MFLLYWYDIHYWFDGIQQDWSDEHGDHGPDEFMEGMWSFQSPEEWSNHQGKDGGLNKRLFTDAAGFDFGDTVSCWTEHGFPQKRLPWLSIIPL
jgi:hypothetical protein